VVPLLGLLFVLGGSHGVVFKLFAESGTADQRALCLLFVYGVAAIVNVGVVWARGTSVGPRELGMGTILGICNVAAVLPFILLLERTSGAVAFPLVSGGGVVGCLLLTRVVLGERLSRRAIAGALLAAAALVLLRLG
jgi:multidrug transporter EmrE-like cation transporter